MRGLGWLVLLAGCGSGDGSAQGPANPTTTPTSEPTSGPTTPTAPVTNPTGAVVLPTPPAEVAADLELLQAGAVDTVAPVDLAHVVVSTEGQLVALDALGAPEVLGRDQPPVHAASPWAGSWLLASAESLAVWDGAVLGPTTLGDVVGPVARLASDGDDLWIGAEAGLRRWRDGQVVAVTVDGAEVGPFAVGGDVRGDSVTWVAQGEVVHALGNAGAVWVDLEAAALAGTVDALAVDASRTAWATAGGWLYRRDANDGWLRYDLGVPVWAVHGVPSAAGVWIEAEGMWLFSDGTTWEAPTGLPAPDPMLQPRVDAAGRLLVVDDDGLWRASTTRPLVLVGLEQGAVVARSTEVHLVPTAPDEVETLVVSLVDGAGAEVAVPVVEQVATVDPEGLEPGPYELVAVADYGERQSEARLSLFLGADFEPTWADDIQPLYEAQCALCHGGAATTVLEAPEDWAARIDDILFNVRAGNMPLGGDPLSDLDVAVIEAWAAAGYP